MSAFTRSMSSSLIGLLKGNKFFNSILLPDIQAGEVFPAIRNESMDFYHKGGKLFGFDKDGFYTHKKYAGLFDTAGRKYKDYVSADEIMKYHGITDMREIYERIKEYCARFSGMEALGVSSLYHANPFTSNENNFAVLDIEVSLEGIQLNSQNMQIIQEQDEKISSGESFEMKDKERKNGAGVMDRIDMLFIDSSDKKRGTLKFVEAKHYSNPQIRSNSPEPEVYNQILRYDKQLAHKKAQIEKEYNNYCKLMNDIFALSLPVKNEIVGKTRLLVFGFDDAQKYHNDYFEKLRGLLSHEFCKRGSVDSLTQDNLYNMFYK